MITAVEQDGLGLLVAARAVIKAKLVTSPPFLAKKAQSAQFTVSTKSSASSTIFVVGKVVQLPIFICWLTASSTSGSL